MNYGEIKLCDIANGIGVRVSLFVSGCRNKCKNCFNPMTWAFNYGKEFDQNAVKLILEKETRVDYLINNAGMGIAGSISDSNYEDILHCFNVNVLGTIRVTKEFLPILTNGRGRIINIGSVAGDLTIPYQGYYSMSKTMIDKFSECLDMELHNRRIHVTNILPGDTKTDFTINRKTTIKEDENQSIRNSIKKMENDEQNGVSPRKVSKLIFSVMRKKHPPIRVAVGFKYKFFLFLQRILPRKVVIFILKKLYS